jgi:hypothetical protein
MELLHCSQLSPLDDAIILCWIHQVHYVHHVHQVHTRKLDQNLNVEN